MSDMLRPLFDQVVVKEIRPGEVRRSGLMVPSTVADHGVPPHHGVVVAVGAGMDWWEHVGFSMPVAPGDHVVFPYTAGTYVEVEEERLLVLRVGQILGVLEDSPASVEHRGGSFGGAERPDGWEEG